MLVAEHSGDCLFENNGDPPEVSIDAASIRYIRTGEYLIGRREKNSTEGLTLLISKQGLATPS